MLKSAHSIRKESYALIEEMLADGLKLRIQVTGKSMSPFLRGEDVVTLKKIQVGDCDVGDLVLCKNDRGLLMLHRVIKKSRTPKGFLWI